MSKISKILNKIYRGIYRSVERFPEAIFISMLLTFLLILEVHDIGLLEEDILIRAVMTLVALFVLSVDIKLISEQLQFKKSSILLLDASIIAIGILLYSFIPNKLTVAFIIPYITSIIAMALVFTLIPYAKSKENYGFYVLYTGIGAIVSIFYSEILFAGLSGIMFSLKSLFELPIKDEIYLDIMLLSIGLFGVTYFLGNLKGKEITLGEKDFFVFIRILLSYIVIPLLYVYTFILYAYFLRMLIVFEWPSGILAHLVLWFGMLAFFVYLVIDILDFKNIWLSRYQKHFPKLFLLPNIMMLVSLWIRIKDYGITLNRYFVLLACIWFFIMIAIHLLRVKEERIYFLVGLAIILLVTVAGPLSPYNVTYNSQVNRLSDILVEEEMLVDGTIVNNDDIGQESRERIRDIVKYLHRMEMLDKVEYIPKDFYVYDDFKKVFGFEDFEKQMDEEKNYVSYAIKPWSSMEIGDGVRIPIRRDWGDDGIVNIYEDAHIEVVFDFPLVKIIGDSESSEFNIEEFLNDRVGVLGVEETVLSEDLVFEKELKYYIVSIQFERLEGRKNDEGKYSLQYYEGNIFIVNK